MGFVSVLSKIGKGILAGLKIFSPVAGVFAPAGGVLGRIAIAIMAAERVAEAANLTTAGGIKMEGVEPLAAEAIKASEIVAGHEIGDESLFGQGVRKIVSGIHDVIKSLKQ